MKKYFLWSFAILLFSHTVIAQAVLRTKHFNLENGIAIHGYDVMAYFINHKAMMGTKKFQLTVDGVTYYFSSQANKDLFQKDPKRFEPQYGGWCAYAMGANNDKVEIDPETFKLIEEKLYLFYHKWGNNTLTKWNADEINLKTKADKNWNVFFK